MENHNLAVAGAEFHSATIFAGRVAKRRPFRFILSILMSSLEELEELAESLLRQAQQLPPGPDRNDALTDIGKLRKKLDALKRQNGQDTKLPPRR